MPRNRVVKPEFWSNPQICQVSRDARLLYIGMWHWCDDAGNCPAVMQLTRARVFPLDESVGQREMQHWVGELIAAGLLFEYTVSGSKYWHVINWDQRANRPTVRYPEPPAQSYPQVAKGKNDSSADFTEGSLRAHGGLTEYSLNDAGMKVYPSGCYETEKDVSGTTFAFGSENAAPIYSVSLDKGVVFKTTSSITPLDTPISAGVASASVPNNSAVQNQGKPAIAASQATTRIGMLCIEFRKLAITASPLLLQSPAWQDMLSRTTDDDILGEARALRDADAERVLSANYLLPLLRERLKRNAGPSLPPKKKTPEWWSTHAGIDKMGRSLGMMARGGESYEQYRDRIAAKLEKMQAENGGKRGVA